MKKLKKNPKQSIFHKGISACPFCFSDADVDAFQDARKPRIQVEAWNVWCLSDYCLPGGERPDEEGISGYGKTKEDAILDWNKKCQLVNFNRRQNEERE